MPPLHIFTICLDAMPFITWILPMLNRLDLDWHWHIAEGVAAATKCTSWCKHIDPRLSRDGTKEYLDTFKHHPRIKLWRKEIWQGKIEMCNACVSQINEPCILLQMDADEIWTAEQLKGIVQLFVDRPQYTCARFFCRYFLGPNIIALGENSWSNRAGEYLRAWHFKPGCKFTSHEPPFLLGANGHSEYCASREDTRRAGLVFDHYAYAFEAQVQFKQEYYGYDRAVEHWKRLQANRVWPVPHVHRFLPWAEHGTGADLLFKP